MSLVWRSYTPPPQSDHRELDCAGGYVPPPMSDHRELDCGLAQAEGGLSLPALVIPSLGVRRAESWARDAGSYTPPPQFLYRPLICDGGYVPPPMSDHRELDCGGDLGPGDASASGALSLPALVIPAIGVRIVGRITSVRSAGAMRLPALAIPTLGVSADGRRTFVFSDARAGLALPALAIPVLGVSSAAQRPFPTLNAIGPQLRGSAQAGATTERGIAAAVSAGRNAQSSCGVSMRMSERRAAPIGVALSMARGVARDSRLSHQAATGAGRRVAWAMQQGRTVADDLRALHQAARAEGAGVGVSMAVSRDLRHAVRGLAQAGRVDAVIAGWAVPMARLTQIGLALPVSPAIAPPLGRWQLYYIPPPMSAIRGPDCSRAYCPPDMSCHIYLGRVPVRDPGCPCADGGASPPEWPTPGIIIPIRLEYHMINDVSVIMDGVDLGVAAVSVALSRGAGMWTYDLTLTGRQALDALEGGSGVLDVRINGWQGTALATDWAENVAFSQYGLRVQADGLSSELGGRYMLPGDGVNAAGTVEQVLAALLPIDGSHAIQWDAYVQPWLVPAGAWSYQGQTPLQAIVDAIRPLRLRLDPHPTQRIMTLAPYWPILPWDYAGATPDLEIPADVVSSYQRARARPTQADGVLVHGADVGGISALVKRAITATPTVAPTAQSPLATDQDAARLMGGQILAEYHQPPTWRSITMPLGGDYPPAARGQVVAIAAGADSQIATVSAWRADARMQQDGGMRVEQTLDFDAAPSSGLDRLRALIPGAPPTLLGEITAVHSGLVDVELSGGGVVRVRGGGQIGDAVWVRGQEVVGSAPGMAAVSIDV